MKSSKLSAEGGVTEDDDSMRRIVTVFAFGLGLLAFYDGFQGVSTAHAQQKAVPQSMEQVQLSYAPIVKEVAPAVVNVYAKRVVSTRSRRSLFDDFFGGRGFGIPRQRIEQSLGSGVIVGSDGIIVTNNHVIEGGLEYTVVLQDRREFDAELILADERTDLAILRIDTGDEDLPVSYTHLTLPTKIV